MAKETIYCDGIKQTVDSEFAAAYRNQQTMMLFLVENDNAAKAKLDRVKGLANGLPCGCYWTDPVPGTTSWPGGIVLCPKCRILRECE